MGGISMSYSIIEIKKIRMKLNFATKFLLAAALVQLLLFLPNSSPSLHQKIFNFVMTTSAVFGGIGFFIAYRQLDLQGEASENSAISGMVGPNLKGAAVLF